MPLEHTSYEKISENENKWVVTEEDYRKFNKHNWVVTEKIHGANFCILSDGERVICAKRKEILNAGESFFGHANVVHRISTQIRKLYTILHQDNPQLTSISVYGELFGGDYPHAEVEKKAGISAVQTGVYYSPDIEFSIFDIAITSGATREYLTWDVFCKVLDEVQLLRCQSLFTGKYQKAMAFNERFQSTIPSLLGLPKIEDNLAEGVVIKPVVPVYVSSKKGAVRAILKKKISEFTESKKFHEAQKWSESSIWESWKYTIDAMLTKNRVDSAISKIGNVSVSDAAQVQKVCDLVVEDLAEELNLDVSQHDLMTNVRATVQNFVVQCL
ncbi:RNA ligase family protein [Candidatus Uabimicrobium amorphum]|uniref:RNA ligase (ATP) n=1 Tax=Uabimicrobium amorphum TaxID=2596890 RepID=A0A5S9IU62_UABAM|nr:RNA ligase family protein [Candidatus Uabimicrobium amorphum]BBM88004.1 hypothetical protein UABAM_06420 [Candidatus Uabimicrobium amorphum]